MSEWFDVENIIIMNKVTGEQITDIAMFVDDSQSVGWEKSYAKTLSEYIDCGGDKSAKFLAWMVKARDGRNMIIGTQQEFADESGASLSVVKRIMKRLIDKEMIRKVKYGHYMINPSVIGNGYKLKGAMMLRVWDASK